MPVSKNYQRIQQSGLNDSQISRYFYENLAVLFSELYKSVASIEFQFKINYVSLYMLLGFLKESKGDMEA